MDERSTGWVSWMADLLFSDHAPDVVPTYEHSWPLSPAATLLLIVVSAGFVLLVYAREQAAARGLYKSLLAGLRVGLLLIVVFMMYGWMKRQHRVDLPDLIVMLDDSASMALEDHYDDASTRRDIEDRLAAVELDQAARFDLAKALLLAPENSLLESLQSRYNVKLFLASATARQQDAVAGAAIGELSADGDSSRLGECLRNVIEMQRGRPTAAVLLLTDGVTTAGPALSEAADYAKRKSVPVYAIGLGNDKAPKDLRLADLLVDEVVFAGDTINFDFKLSASGYRNERVTVRLKRGGETSPLAEKSVLLNGDDDSKPLRLSYREEREGDYEFVVEIEPQADEANTKNNQLRRRVSVRDETIRVLLVQEYPNYEFRFLKTMLERSLKQSGDGDEKAFQLTTVLQEADLDYTELDATAEKVFPVSRERLFEYDVLIFGDVNRAHLSRSTMNNIADFVKQRGGGVVFIAGPRHTPLAYRDSPLADLFPIDLASATAPPPDAMLDEDAEFRVEPTRLGLTSPQLQLASTPAESLMAWRSMPPLYWLLEAPDTRPAARVLAQHPTRSGANGVNLPVIAMQFVGAGKVVFHATDESYRWGKHSEGDIYYHRYWLQTIRFLSRAKLLGGSRDVEISSDRREYRRGDVVRLRARFFDDRLAPPQDDGVTIVLERSNGKRQQVKLYRDDANRGVFEATVANLSDGEHRAWLATPTVEGQPPSQQFTITAPLGEQARLQMDAADLQLTAKVSGGRFHTLATVDQLLDELPEGRKVRIESMPPEPIWNTSYLAGLFVVLIVSEWLLRKRAGML